MTQLQLKPTSVTVFAVHSAAVTRQLRATSHLSCIDTSSKTQKLVAATAAWMHQVM